MLGETMVTTSLGFSPAMIRGKEGRLTVKCCHLCTESDLSKHSHELRLVDTGKKPSVHIGVGLPPARLKHLHARTHHMTGSALHRDTLAKVMEQHVTFIVYIVHAGADAATLIQLLQSGLIVNSLVCKGEVGRTHR